MKQQKGDLDRFIPDKYILLYGENHTLLHVNNTCIIIILSSYLLEIVRLDSLRRRLTQTTFICWRVSRTLYNITSQNTFANWYARITFQVRHYVRMWLLIFDHRNKINHGRVRLLCDGTDAETSVLVEWTSACISRSFDSCFLLTAKVC
jgi:hypothetical protein